MTVLLHETDWSAEEERLIKIRQQWYALPHIQFAIKEQCKNKELAFLTKYPKNEYYKDNFASVIRYNQVGHTKFLLRHMDAYGFLRKPFMNIYSSLAMLSHIPVFSYNLKERTQSQEYQKYVYKDYDTFINGFDILFDLDNIKIKDALTDAIKLRDLFNEYEVPYSICFSGSKGFHLRIPARYVTPTQETWREQVKELAQFIYYVKQIYQIESIDESITDTKRIVKLHYSLDRDNVVLPLGDRQLEGFSTDFVKYDTVIRSTPLKDRGDLLRTHGLSFQTLKKNVKEFVKGHL